MKVPRNPFRIRFSENIMSESDFLRLFGPGALDLLPKDGLWDRVQIFRSAPGGGKTSIFRIFTPNSLRHLHASRASDDYKELYSRLKNIDAISESGPHVLGVYLSCARVYANLEDLSFESEKKNRLFKSLLNARIVLATLRGALSLKNLNYPDDLSELCISNPSDMNISNIIPVPCSGTELHKWASSIEKNVFDAIDSFSYTYDNTLVGHDDLYSLFILQPKCITLNEIPIARHTLVMLDDVHELTSIQRKELLKMSTLMRLPIGIWLAERLEALSEKELLLPGVTLGREYNEIKLEEFWTNHRRFENIVINIADLRARLTPDFQISSFAGQLENSLDGVELYDQYLETSRVISERICNEFSSKKKYTGWLNMQEKFQGTPREQAIAWRALEILIARDKGKKQKTFSDIFNQPILEDEMIIQKDDQSLKGAAELFLTYEFKFPYYFGISRISKIASSNIEQFLAFAGDLFEEIISAEKIKETSILSPNHQEKILQKAVRQRWDEIPKRIPNGRDVLKLLESIQKLAQWETFKPNAPYAPGVTGIAISMSDCERLIDPAIQEKLPKYARLAKILKAAITHNLLEVHPDKKQGKKGTKWMIFYLNRMLCLYFGLPLQYGGWRGKKIDELCTWLDEGVKLPKK